MPDLECVLQKLRKEPLSLCLVCVVTSFKLTIPDS